jgi:acetyl esterase
MFNKNNSFKGSGVAAVIAVTFIFSCNSNESSKKVNSDTSSAIKSDTASSSSGLKPSGPKPAWGKDMTDPMTVVIEKLGSYNAPPLTTLSAQEARKQPTPATAAMDVIKEHNITVPAGNFDTTGKDIPVTGGQIHLRIYTPKTGKASYPMIVYIHGGGWVIADLDTYHASVAGLTDLTEAVIISVAYRQAPEHKFPAAHNDCFAAYQWAIANAASIKGDPKKIALVGESAGGNLATSVSMMARDKGVQMPVYQVLVYPIAGYDFTTPSYTQSDSTKPLSSGLMKWFFEKYLNSPADGKSPMISLVNANLKGLPPTTIIAAQYDPLLSEGKMLADKLSAAGVKTNYKLYNGVTHEFFGMAAILQEAKDAQALAASDIKSAFLKITP